MKLIPVSAGNFHCDGGALFGAIPKVLWNKVYPCDENNFTKLNLLCLLVETGDRKILIETGIGNHYPEKHFKNMGVTSVTEMVSSLKEKGYSTEDITDVFFTHLHWDHCTGAVKTVDGKLELVFPNATMWSSKTQWEHAKISNPRERAAYHRPILDFLMESGKLQLIEKEGELFPGFEIRMFNGHTPGQMLPILHTKKHSFIYTSDLVPTAANIPMLWISAYDLDPAQVMEEKEKFLKEAAKKNYVLFFEHDYYTECATVQETEKGVQLKEKLSLAELL
ncbi:MBL fold metallo-hydrolase [Draconibacterium sp. IB214405]|uniref:MBL fold metallo-hydrolase n=1 Tax=Draconibacterium sp. IB214405 TaxID=3097352 RepID=UPI002A13387D|nr:MBL fold metallo-hydrolase [Draconibacterium sp. IB214405]MDX8337608.1 MBL fold metallo-hydrolase [Draconibacterium sp. IB214405]